MNVELGVSAPLPDFIGWIGAADRCNCAPWDFFEPDDPYQPPRIYWQSASSILADAESRAARSRQARDEMAAKRR